MADSVTDSNVVSHSLATSIPISSETTSSYDNLRPDKGNISVKSSQIALDAQRTVANIQTTIHFQPTTSSNIQSMPTPGSTATADESVAAALKDIKMAIQATRVLQHQGTRIPHAGIAPISGGCSTIPARNNPVPDGIIMNGSATNKIPRIAEGNGLVGSASNASNIDMMARSSNEVPMGVASADNMGSSDPWVPRGNVAPHINPGVSFMKNNDIQHIPIASSSSNEMSIRGTIGNVPVTNEMNTSQAVQTIPTQTTQHTEATTLQMPSRTLTNNESMIAPSLASQQPINTSSVKEPGKPHNNMMTENEKGAGRRDRIHSQDLNIDDDVEDIEEDDEEDEDEDEEIEDDESESEVGEERVPTPKNMKDAADDDLDTDQETDRLLGQQYNDDNGYYDSKVSHNVIIFIRMLYDLLSPPLFMPTL